MGQPLTKQFEEKKGLESYEYTDRTGYNIAHDNTAEREEKQRQIKANKDALILKQKKLEDEMRFSKYSTLSTKISNKKPRRL